MLEVSPERVGLIARQEGVQFAKAKSGPKARAVH